MIEFSFPMDAGTFFTMVIYAIAFAFPIFMCNSFTNFSKIIPFLGTPVDFGKTWKGKRILGDHKTWRGLIFGIIFGTIAGIIVWYVCTIQYNVFSVYPWYLGFFMSIGDHFADLLGSFSKRRIGVKPGGALPLYDQGSWMVTGMLLALPFVCSEPNFWFYFVTLTILTPVLHFLTGFLAYWGGIKDVWY